MIIAYIVWALIGLDFLVIGYVLIQEWKIDNQRNRKIRYRENQS